MELLLLVKTNLIEVFTCVKSKLLLHSKHSFVARVESIEIFSKPSQDSDLVLITFPDCKMTVFEYSGLINDFVPKSFHFFERENYRTSTILGTGDSMKPTISLDPEGRMAAVRVFTSHLALLPLEEDESAVSSSSNSSSSIINFAQQIDSRLKVVRNLTFLPGFLNPTMAILYDRGSNEGESDKTDLTLRTVLNHCDETRQKETCALMIIAIEPVKYSKHRSAPRIADSGNFQYTVVNCIEGIPFDAEGLHPLPKPVGGLFISCANLLLWCDISSSTAPYSIALNQFAPLTYSARISITQFQSLQIASLLDCRFLSLGTLGSSNVLKCLLLTKHGERLVISISRTGRTLGYFNIELMTGGASVAASPSDLILWDERTIFVGSEGGCSQLISLFSTTKHVVEPENDTVTITPSEKATVKQSGTTKLLAVSDDIDAFLYGEDVEMVQAPLPPPPPPSSSSTNLKSIDLQDDDYLMVLEKEELALASVNAPSSSMSSKNKSKTDVSGPLLFELLDELESLGPMLDLAIGESGTSEDTTINELVSIGGAFTHRSSGQFFAGSVNVMSQRIPTAVQLSFNLPDTRAIWTLNEKSETKYLVASTMSSTLVLITSQARIVELEESDFYLEGPTLFCGTLSDSMIVQVFPTGIKLLTFEKASLIRECRLDLSGVVSVATGMEHFYCLGSDDLLREFSIIQLQCTRTWENVSTFTIDPHNQVIFVVFTCGSISILDRKAVVLFENSFFSRLPVSLSNRPEMKSQQQVELQQKILSLDLIGNENSSSFLIVRYECQKTLGMATYRITTVESPHNYILQRVNVEALRGPSIGSTTSLPASVNLTNEVILYFSNQTSSGTPISSLGINQRSYPRQHILLPNDSTDAFVVSLAAYNQTSLMVLDSKGFVSILDLDKMRRKYDLNWQSGWYLKRIGLSENRIPTHVAYHGPSRTYLVASAEFASDFTLPADEYAPISDNGMAVAYEGPVNKLFGANSNALHLINPMSWSVVDSTSSEQFLPYEGVTCMRSLPLETRQTASGFSSFLTVGTAYQKSEDRPIRGRALVFDVADVVPEPGKPETNKKLRLKGATDFKGPVMAFTPLLQGNVAVSAGAKVIVNTFEEDEKFAGVAFHDVGTCTLALASLKSFFTTADLVKSVAFFAFQAEPLARIHELGRDFGQNIQTTAVEFLVNSKGQTLLVTSDDQGGLHFFTYAPNNLTTNSGQRLLDKGSFYLHGAPVNKLHRIPIKNDFGVLSAGQDGSINLIVPIQDSFAFRRLFVLEMRLGAVLPSAGGLISRITRQVPRRMNVTHALPATTSQYPVTLPTSSIKVTSEDSSNTNNSDLNSTLILHHLPVSTTIIDSQAIKRFISDPLCDGLARQIFANRFGLEGPLLHTLMARKTASDFFKDDNDVIANTKNENDNEAREKAEVRKADGAAKISSLKEPTSGTETMSEKETVIIQPAISNSGSSISLEQQQQYMQYMQYYQQYQQQYYAQNFPQSQAPQASDPVYELYSGSSMTPAGASFDAGRATRQMAAYFDPTKFNAVLSPEMQAAQRAQKDQQQAKLTAKEIEAFKKRKIEKKKGKNRWFYE